MRPKKRVLLVDRNADRAGVLRFVLRIWRFNVAGTVCCGADAVAWARQSSADVVLARQSGDEQEVACAAHILNVPLVVVCGKLRGSEGFAQRTLKNPTMAELIEAVRVASARKRGPRKGKKRGPTMAEAGAVVARRTA